MYFGGCTEYQVRDDRSIQDCDSYSCDSCDSWLGKLEFILELVAPTVYSICNENRSRFFRSNILDHNCYGNRRCFAAS